MDVVKDPGNDRESTLTELVVQYQSLLLRICYVSLRDEDLARDAVQETFLKAYRGLDGFRGASSAKTWLVQIALNTCRSMRRSAWMRYLDRRITPEELPMSAAVDEEDTTLMDAVMHLPTAMREAVMLYYWQGMTATEIAQLLGTTQSTISRRLTQARHRLRALLDRREPYGREQGSATDP